MRVLVKIASRARPDRIRSVVHAFMVRRSKRHDVAVLVSIDDDDHAMTPAAVEQLRDLGAEVVRGPSRNKVDAINRDLEGRQFDVLVAAADDMMPSSRWDATIAADMERFWPNLDGALHYDDGHVGDRLCTIPVLGYNLWRKLGYIYSPAYSSLWCDNEQTDVLRALRRLHYLKRTPIEHRHPSYNRGFVYDDLLRHTESFYDADHATYRARHDQVRPGAIIGFQTAPVLLSICIASITTRRPLLASLLAKLNGQINALPEPMNVELLVEVDAKQAPVGRKRNALLDRAIGAYVCYVDDDDDVADDYVRRIVEAIVARPDADCVGLKGIITTGGRDPRVFIHSITCGGYFERDGIYYRTPNHLNPVRLAHARATRFPELRCGEDAQYAGRLATAGLLKAEVMLDDPPVYFYRYDPKHTATQQRRGRRR